MIKENPEKILPKCLTNGKKIFGTISPMREPSLPLSGRRTAFQKGKTIFCSGFFIENLSKPETDCQYCKCSHCNRQDFPALPHDLQLNSQALENLLRVLFLRGWIVSIPQLSLQPHFPARQSRKMQGKGPVPKAKAQLQFRRKLTFRPPPKKHNLIFLLTQSIANFALSSILIMQQLINMCRNIYLFI